MEDTESAIYNHVLPSITNDVIVKSDKLKFAQLLVDGMILDAKTKFDTVHFVDKRFHAKVILTLNIPAAKANAANDVKIGPFDLDKDETILTLVQKIQVC